MQRGLYIAITGHGYGHAVRVSAVIKEILARSPSMPITINTQLPRENLIRLLEFGGNGDQKTTTFGLPDSISLCNRPLDIAIRQTDSIHMDLKQTLIDLEKLIRASREIVEEEVEFIQKHNIAALLSDIPPMSSRIGREASIATLAMGNFGWDFIYRNLGTDFQFYAEWCSILYRNTDLLFRLPFHEPMESFPYSLDVGLPVLHPLHSPEFIRKELNLTDQKCILVTFGGLDLRGIPWENVGYFNGKKYPARTFLTYDQSAPDLPNIRKVTNWIAPDLLSISDLVFTKPGFGILSDAYLAGKPIIVVKRDDFAETPFLYTGLKNYYHSRTVSAEQCFSNDWSFLLEECESPLSTQPLATDGASVIAERIVQIVDGQ